MPSAVTSVEAVRPRTTWGSLVCAPAREYWSCFTQPPWLSVASRDTVTAELFQPFALGLGVRVAVVDGRIRSRAAKTARLLATERPVAGLSDVKLTMLRLPVARSSMAMVVEPPPSS
jgi:hypothetical protein